MDSRAFDRPFRRRLREVRLERRGGVPRWIRPWMGWMLPYILWHSNRPVALFRNRAALARSRRLRRRRKIGD